MPAEPPMPDEAVGRVQALVTADGDMIGWSFSENAFSPDPDAVRELLQALGNQITKRTDGKDINHDVCKTFSYVAPESSPNWKAFAPYFGF